MSEDEVHLPTLKDIKSFGLSDDGAENFYAMLDKFHDYKVRKVVKKETPVWKIVMYCVIASIVSVVLLIAIIDSLNNPNGIIRSTLPQIKIGT